MVALNALLQALSVNVTEYNPGILVEISGFSIALFEKFTDVSDDVQLGSVDDWEWRGPTKDLGAIAKQLNMTDLVERTERAMVGRRS